jgi:hypothetical protein
MRRLVWALAAGLLVGSTAGIFAAAGVQADGARADAELDAVVGAFVGLLVGSIAAGIVWAVTSKGDAGPSQTRARDDVAGSRSERVLGATLGVANSVAEGLYWIRLISITLLGPFALLWGLYDALLITLGPGWDRAPESAVANAVLRGGAGVILCLLATVVWRARVVRKRRERRAGAADRQPRNGAARDR